MQVFESNNIDIDITKRLDFNFWNPRKELETTEGLEVKRLSNWCGKKSLITSAFYPAITPFYQKVNEGEDLLPFIRVEDTRKLLLSFEDTVFLNRDLLDLHSSTIKRVSPRDVVITKGGEYIGEASLVPHYFQEYAICRDVLAIKTSESKISGEYLTSYFQSKYGKEDLVRTRSVQGQPHLTLDKVYDLDIPYYGEEFETEIIEYWETFYTLIDECNEHLKTAKDLLNEFLQNKLDVGEGLDTFTKELNSSNITKRIDFDYYHNRWSNLVIDLKKSGISFEKINYIKESVDFSDPQKLYNYITLSDIDDRSGIIKNYREIVAHNLPDRARRAVKYKDVLVSSLKGSKGKIAIIEDDFENLVASTGFYVIRSEKIMPEVLYVIFRSKYYELLIEQMASGAIMSSIIETYFKKLEIPILSDIIQNKIAYEVQNYLTKRELAFENLEVASMKFDEEFETN
jgi:restriction endonuclease S subunit